MTDIPTQRSAPSPARDAADPPRVRAPLRRFSLWISPESQLSFPGALWVLTLFLVGVLLWSFGARQLEEWLGAIARTPRAPVPGPSGVDALWHVATALLLALPTRNRVALALAPALALGLDIDHIFGTFLPTVVMRQAHALAFVLVIMVALYAVHGRPAALLAGGAIFAHIGVDGGTFPFWAPFSATLSPLARPEQVVFIAAAALLFFLAVRSTRDLRQIRGWASVAGVVALLGAVLVLAWPAIQPYASG